jgi:GT2 family glycosyltransferase
MTNEELAGLYSNKQIKAFVNLAHGEGFGLPMFEAAQHKLPVIAPAWSGHCDFLYGKVENKKTKKTRLRPLFARVDYKMGHVQQEAVWNSVIQQDSMWCFPEEKSYKRKIREVYKDYNRFVGMANKLYKHIMNTFTDENQYKQFAEAVLDEKITVFDANVLPKISVITSVYNGDEFIRPFLEDMTSQTVFDKCELILVNADSPGNEEEVIHEYMAKYDNIVYKKLDKDPGIYGTWNEAIKMSSGEYITNANLDDRKHPSSIELHARQLYDNPDIGLVYADSYITNSPNETFENNSSQARRYNFEQFSKEAMLRGNQPHNNPMWRKELHDRHGLFDSDFRSAGDWEFFLRCAFEGETFQKLNDVLGLYYFNPKGISTDFENFAWKQEEEKRIYTKYKTLFEKERQNEQEDVIIQPVQPKNTTTTQDSR